LKSRDSIRDVYAGEMFVVMKVSLVFQTRNFRGSQKMNRWLRKSRSLKRGCRT